VAILYYLSQTVLEAARERIAYLFDEFEVVIAGYSGGKDSTVVLELALEEAKRRGRMLPVLFVDQEAEWQGTVDLVRDVMGRDGVVPYWLQVPIKLFNATSTEDEWLMCWDPDREADWMRPQEIGAFTANLYGTDRFGELFGAFLKVHYRDTRACFLSGVRTEESPTRMMGLTHQATYKWITWGKKFREGLHYTFYPIFDWGWRDVWKAINDHDWRYNRVYDYQYWYGVPVNDMRVSNVHHETAVKALFWLQEFEPETYAKLTHRIGGVDMAGKMNRGDYFLRHCPPMFKGWEEYRDFLLDKLISEEHQLAFLRQFHKQDLLYGGRRGDALLKEQVQAILTNDYHMTKLGNFDRRPENVGVRRALIKELEALT
jgi:predicted phosphoadenosine phosphosulfate sulfurtransferase